jgi:hypothetical protein
VVLFCFSFYHWFNFYFVLYRPTKGIIYVETLSQVTDKLYHILSYRVHLAWVGFDLTTLEVIGTDCIDSYKSNYHTILAPERVVLFCFSFYRWFNFYFVLYRPTKGIIYVETLGNLVWTLQRTETYRREYWNVWLLCIGSDVRFENKEHPDFLRSNPNDVQANRG